MNTLFANNPKVKYVILVILMSLSLSHCADTSKNTQSIKSIATEVIIPPNENPVTTEKIPTENSDGTTTPEEDTSIKSTTPTRSSKDHFIGELAFVSQCCECRDSDIALLTLPDGDTTFVIQDQANARQPAWSPDDRKLAYLSYGIDEQVLRVLEFPTQRIHFEWPGFIPQFAWSSDGNSIFYLDDQEKLFKYDLAEQESKLLADGVSYFSVSPTGKWLGLSKRESRENLPSFNFFTFRVLDLENGNLLTTSDEKDTDRLGTNRSFWSPITNEVAVIFGGSTTQLGKIVMYSVHENDLEIKNNVIAPETYLQDYGKDKFVNFTDITWLPDGQKLLAIRSVSETGGEILLFDNVLSTYQRLPFGENVTLLTWTRSNEWFSYTTSRNTDSCFGPLGGALWLANIESLETRVLVTDTLSIERPAWRP